VAWSQCSTKRARSCASDTSSQYPSALRRSCARIRDAIWSSLGIESHPPTFDHRLIVRASPPSYSIFCCELFRICSHSSRAVCLDSSSRTIANAVWRLKRNDRFTSVRLFPTRNPSTSTKSRSPRTFSSRAQRFVPRLVRPCESLRNQVGLSLDADKQKEPLTILVNGSQEYARQDLNLQPLAPEASALSN
jgi:hypothetical protein